MQYKQENQIVKLIMQFINAYFEHILRKNVIKLLQKQKE